VSLKEWSEELKRVLQTLPQPGDILTTVSGKAVLTIELAENKSPFIYGRIYVPTITDIEVAWRLQNEETYSFNGLKCILLPKARTEVLSECEIVDDKIFVTSLRVVRQSLTGKSLLCEVGEI
jgi:hypothetical protein